MLIYGINILIRIERNIVCEKNQSEDDYGERRRVKSPAQIFQINLT